MGDMKMEASDYKIIKQNEKLLNLLRFNKGIERAELSRRLQLSMPTIYKFIDELTNDKLINKNDNGLSINNNYGILVGISIGSSLCKIVFLNHSFSKLNFEEFSSYKKSISSKIMSIINDKSLLSKCKDDNSKNYVYFKTPSTFSELKSILDSLFDCLKNYMIKDNINIFSIGISCTGIINSATQTILDAYNLVYLSNRTLDSLILPNTQSFFQERNVQISLIQNSSASVIAEKIYLNHYLPIYKNKKNIIAVYFGVGIGMGIYLDKLYEGTSGYAGEIGHIKAPDLEDDVNNEYYEKKIEEGIIDRFCTCGHKDCFDYKIRTYVFEKSAEAFCEMSADEIRKYLETHPEKAQLLGSYLGYMANMLTSLLNVDMIIFTGKLYKSMDLIINYIDKIRDESPLTFNRNDCKILNSIEGSLSPAIGAAIYSYHKKYNLNLSWDY